jgi:hypothetical protein
MGFGIFSVADHNPRELGRTTGERYAEFLEHAHRTARGPASPA